jgi:FMN phosphatase YigB (HAD superfamily)
MIFEESVSDELENSLMSAREVGWTTVINSRKARQQTEV